MTPADAVELQRIVWQLVQMIESKDAEIARLRQPCPSCGATVHDPAHRAGCVYGVQREMGVRV